MTIKIWERYSAETCRRRPIGFWAPYISGEEDSF
jgi:hypothetical protein